MTPIIRPMMVCRQARTTGLRYLDGEPYFLLIGKNYRSLYLSVD